MRKIADYHVHMSDLNFTKGEMLLDIIEQMGTKRVALQSLTYRSVAYNLWLLYWKENYKKMDVAVYGMVHNKDIYKDIPFEVQAKALIDMGCDGIKMMYEPGSRRELGYGINDARYDKMFTYLEENNIPMVIHVNDPERYWEERELTPVEIERGWGYFKEGFLSKQEIYDETFEMLDKHPNLKITFAHFFFLSCFKDEAERVLETYPNVNFDLTPGWEMFLGFSKDIAGWQKFFEKYADRILFGTDCNNVKNFNAEIHLLVRMALTHDETEFVMPCYKAARIKGLNLNENILDKICYENYDKIVGTPKPVNMDMVLNSAKRVLKDIENSEDEKMVKASEWIKELLEKYNV